MRLPKLFKKILKGIGIHPLKLFYNLSFSSLKMACKQQRLSVMVDKLRKIVVDISDQESSCKSSFNAYWEYKRRLLHSFQCRLMLKALESLNKSQLTIVDIGDSAGTHMLYLKELAIKTHNIYAIGVNLDLRAIEKIKRRGHEAIYCRAEELDFRNRDIDLFTSFEMIEHLHNPAGFLRNLAKKSYCDRFVLTVPYLKNSRVGLHHTRRNNGEIFYAEDEHIFELSPKDWRLLFLHSGWKVVYEDILYQYPRRLLVISSLLASYWRKSDFEGFWGAILEKDSSVSDLYQDWKDKFKT